MSSSTTELPTAIDADLEPGTEVGEYHIENKLGQGAFGTVYKATHPLIGKVVAIKVLATKLSVDPEMVSRFVAEARSVNQIRHRNIIDIFSFGKLADGRQYYVMEYLDGEPLDALIDRETKLSIKDALPILRAIAKALDAAHAKGVAHRDLKAENVFLGRDSDGGLFPKLLDFGIAKLMGREEAIKHKTRTGAPMGTPYYMSPEQCLGKDVDHRTDIYAFGVLVYRMLTGVYPFDADDYMSILMQQLNIAPSPPSMHVPTLPSTIDDVVLWLLAKDAGERPPDLRTAVRALEQAAQDAGIDIGPVATWDASSTPGTAAYKTQPPPRKTSSAPIALAATTAPPSTASAPTVGPPAKSKSKLPLFAAVGGAVVIAGVVAVFALGGSKSEKKPAPAVEPAVAPAPVAPVPTPPPAPAPTPAPPPTPTTAIITVAGVPDGTEVLVGGKVVGVAPGPVQLDRSSTAVVLTFRAEGYVPASKSVVPDGDKPLDVTLKKKAARGGNDGKRPGRDDIIDVFGGKK